MKTKKKLAATWVKEIESDIEDLRDTRNDFRRRLRDLDLETEMLWAAQERRWRRLEVKLRKLANRKSEAVHPGLATNIENLLSKLDEGYEELDSLLD